MPAIRMNRNFSLNNSETEIGGTINGDQPVREGDNPESPEDAGDQETPEDSGNPGEPEL